MITYPLNPLVKSILGLSEDEDAVFEAVRTVQMYARAIQISKKCGVPRHKTNRILQAFEKRKIVSSIEVPGRHTRWKYNRNIDRLRVHILNPEDIYPVITDR